MKEKQLSAIALKIFLGILFFMNLGCERNDEFQPVEEIIVIDRFYLNGMSAGSGTYNLTNELGVGKTSGESGKPISRIGMFEGISYFNNIESIWVKYKSEIIQNRNFKNWNFIDEVFEDYESVKNKYNLINLSFDLENNETIFIDTMKSLYSFNSKQQSSYLFLKYEIKNDYITFYTNISKQNKFFRSNY